MFKTIFVFIMYYLEGYFFKILIIYIVLSCCANKNIIYQHGWFITMLFVEQRKVHQVKQIHI